MSSIAVVGLAYGDEGKGSVVDALVRQTGSKLVVRFNGGPQASHHVVLPDGRGHGFSQWGSGTFAGARTYLSEHMMVEPYALRNEGNVLSRTYGADVFSLLTVNYACPIITPWHWKLNRLRESLRSEKHGTCGMGIGELRSDMIGNKDVFRIEDMHQRPRTKLRRIRERLAEEARSLGGIAVMTDVLDPKFKVEDVVTTYREIFSTLTLTEYMNTAGAIFEGAQGFMLDQTYGWNPHTTWSDCTQAQALMVANDEVDVIGVLPLVYTRHGAGPFVTEAGTLTARRDDHNVHNEWQQGLRRGHFDLVAAKYALRITGIKKVALTMADQFQGIVCMAYRDGACVIDDMANSSYYYNPLALRPHYWENMTIEELERWLGVQVVMVSRGPTFLDKKMTKPEGLQQ